jgi:AcrR family transcriptional regulator
MSSHLSTQTKRPRGRPTSTAPVLDTELIVQAAFKAVAQDGEVSMRGLASALGVDPMALYHYFPNKKALMAALVSRAYEPLDSLPAKFFQMPCASARLFLLSDAYVRCTARLPQLARHLARGEDYGLALRFSRLFEQACEHSVSSDDVAAKAVDVLVDYLNGVALAGPSAARRALAAGWPILMSGLREAL